MSNPKGALSRNVRRLGHLDLPGAGQITIAGKFAYVGHIPNKQNLGTSIIDIADPAHPRLVATVTLDETGGRTTLTTHLVYQSKAHRDGHVMSGMEAGMQETYERLDELLATLGTPA